MGNNESSNSSGFLNPYQFVGDQPWPENVSDDLKPLVKSPYISHQRPHEGAISGVITCELETESPILIAESRKSKDDQQPLKFVKNAEGVPYLPASSLRGAIRTVFEAATNSCYTFPDRKDELIFYRNSHLSQKKRIVPGIVQQNEQGELVFHPLPGTEKLQVQNGTNYTERDYAAWIVRYPKIKKSFDNRPYVSKILKHGERYYALLEQTVHVKRMKNGKEILIPIWAVQEVGKSMDLLHQTVGETSKVVEGYYYQTANHESNKSNFSSKHDERFFFESNDTAGVWPDLPIGSEIKTRYEQLLRESEVRLKPKEKEKDGTSDFVLHRKNWELKHELLVYGVYDSEFEQLIDLTPILVPRLAYHRSYRELVREDHQHCSCINELCPACRVFGWVKGSKEVDKQSAGYASRIAMTDGILIKDSQVNWKKMIVTEPLKPLGAPHPSAVGFYLRKKESKANETNETQFTWKNGDKNQSGEEPPYDRKGADELMIRGRKLYYRHKKDTSNVLNDAVAMKQGQNNQNEKMIQKAELLKPPLTFEFQVQFRNMLPIELGALLWSLQLEEGVFHQLGYGKPLGYGSCKIKITKLITQKNSLKCDDDSEMDGNNNVSKSEAYIELYKTALEQLYGKETNKKFEYIPFINDLIKIKGNNRDDIPIHYPRLKNSDKGYEWYSTHKIDNVTWLPVNLEKDELDY